MGVLGLEIISEIKHLLDELNSRLETEKKIVHANSPQSCLTLCTSIDYRLPGSYLHGVLQARILEWVVISFSKESSQPRDQARLSYVPALAGS